MCWLLRLFLLEWNVNCTGYTSLWTAVLAAFLLCLGIFKILYGPVKAGELLLLEIAASARWDRLRISRDRVRSDNVAWLRSIPDNSARVLAVFYVPLPGLNPLRANGCSHSPIRRVACSLRPLRYARSLFLPTLSFIYSAKINVESEMCWNLTGAMPLFKAN